MAGEDVEFGHVVDLTLGEQSGTELVADAAIGATTLTVDYAGEFEDSGELLLNGATLAYSSIAYGAAEADPDVITLTAPLAAAALTDDKVGRMAGGEPVTEWLLHVSLGDGHPVDIPIPYEQRAMWSSVDVSTPVPVFVSSDLESLVEVPGRPPVIDGSMIDPTSAVPGGQAFSLDAPSDTTGYPEGYGWWQVDADDNVLGFWRLQGGEWVQHAIAPILVGETINGVTITGSTINGTTIQTSTIPDQGIHLDADGLRAYGPAGGSPFFDVSPSKGLVIVAGEGTFDKLTTPGELPAGETSAELGGLTQVKSGGRVTLIGGAIPPAKAPTVGYTYDTVQFNDDDKWANRAGWSTDGTYWYTARKSGSTCYVEKWNASGVRIATSDAVDGDATYGVAVNTTAGRVYMLSGFGLSRVVEQFALSDLSYIGGAEWFQSTGSRAPALGYDSAAGELLIAQPIPSNGNKVRIRRYTITGGSGGTLTASATPVVDTAFAYDEDLAGISYGAHDFAANRYVFTARSGENTFKVVDSTGAAVAAEDWQAPARRVGFTYTGGAFVTMDYTGVMRTFTGLEKAVAIGNANLTKWVSSTNYRAVRTVAVTYSSGSAAITYAAGVLTSADVGAGISGTGIPAGATIATVGATSGTISTNATAPGTSATVTWETPQSPKVSITVNKRSKLTVTTASLPATPGTNDPNQVQVYVGQGASSPTRTNMWRQATPAVGAITASFTSLVTSGTNPPSGNNFPNATAAILDATTNGFTVDANSNGSVGTGTFRDSVRAASVGDYAAGAWTAYTPTFTADTTNPTLGNFTRTGRYIQTGKTVTFLATIQCDTAAGLGTGSYTFGLPVTARALNEVVVTANQTAPNRTYTGRNSVSTSAVYLNRTDTFAVAGSTDVAWTAGTILRIHGTYEAA